MYHTVANHIVSQLFGGRVAIYSNLPLGAAAAAPHGRRTNPLPYGDKNKLQRESPYALALPYPDLSLLAHTVTRKKELWLARFYGEILKGKRLLN